MLQAAAIQNGSPWLVLHIMSHGTAAAAEATASAASIAESVGTT